MKDKHQISREADDKSAEIRQPDLLPADRSKSGSKPGQTQKVDEAAQREGARDRAANKGYD